MIGLGRRKKQNCYLTRETSEKAKWVSIDTKRQEPGLKGTVSMSVEHFSSPAVRFYTSAKHIQIFNLYLQEGRKPCWQE